MEGWMVCTAKMCEGYMWRLIRKYDQNAYMWSVTRNSNLKLIETSSTPWHGAVDQD